MKKTIEVDVAIMGSGVAGMGAAYKLAEKGVTNVAIFEKYPANALVCASGVSGRSCI